MMEQAQAAAAEAVADAIPPGMTLRDAMALSVRMPDEFAASWAAALVGSPQPGLGAEAIEHIDWWARAEAAYRYLMADAMLKAREGEQ